MFKIQAAQRIKAVTQVLAKDALQAGKLFLAIQSAFGKPTSQKEWEPDTWQEGEQEVVWKRKTATIKVTLKQKDYVSVSVQWQISRGKTEVEGEARTAGKALKDLQSQLPDAIRVRGNEPKGGDAEVINKLMNLKI